MPTAVKKESQMCTECWHAKYAHSEEGCVAQMRTCRCKMIYP